MPNTYMRTLDNLLWTRPVTAQKYFTVNMLAGIVSAYLS